MLVGWRRQPHVVEWFGPPLADVAHAERLYGARVRGEAPTRMWVARLDGTPVGYLQDYPVAAYDDYAVKVQDPEAVGFDYAVGSVQHVGRGVGTAMVWSFMREVLCRDYPDVPRFLASPDHRNARSLRTLAKCGFQQGLWIDMPASEHQGPVTEVVCTFDRSHWFGPRLG
jgi:RimJ/RimL family protein N-acetyltransferase